MADTYSLDALERSLGGWGGTDNAHRYGAAWGYLTGPSGMQQLGARFYWPEVGRFVQQDPVRDGMDQYGYAGGNPVAAIDPSGLWSATFEFYYPMIGPIGPGGSVTIGNNPCGDWFVGLHGAVGAGGGICYSPRGSSPGWDPGGPRPSWPGPGWWAGVPGSAGIGVGPLSGSVSPGVGGGWAPGSGWFGYHGWNPDYGVSPGGKWKVGGSVNIGVDLGGFIVPTAF